MNGIQAMPVAPMAPLSEAPQVVQMPEGLPELVNILDGPAAPSISTHASISEPAHREHRDFIDERHKLLLYAGITTLLLLIFRVHN